MSCVQCAELFAVGGSVEVTVAADWRNVFQPDASLCVGVRLPNLAAPGKSCHAPR